MVLEPSTDQIGQTRLIAYLGKGGAGRSTLAAATALRAAELGHRTLLLGIDPGRGLGDILGVGLTSQPRSIRDSLDALQINVLDEVRRDWGRIPTSVRAVLQRDGSGDVNPDDVAIASGVDDVVDLLAIGRHLLSGAYDCLVADC